MSNLSRRGFVGVAGFGVASLALGNVLSACTKSSTSGTSINNQNRSKTEVVIAMNTGSEPAAGFNPLIAWGCGEHVHEPLIQSTLIKTNERMEFENDLTTSYALSDDGMTWTFNMRNDVTFTDGKPLTAKDAAFTINGIINSEAAQADLSMVKKAETPDDFTLVLNMAKPFNALLYTLAVIGIVPAHAYDANYGSNPVGSGRYMLDSWNKGQQVVLKANPDYYGTPPELERVVIVFMEEDAALAAVRVGQVDIAYTSAIFGTQSINGYELFTCKTVDSRGITLPVVASESKKDEKGVNYVCGNDVTSDVAVRRAINLAVDRESMIENVLNGHGAPAFSVSDNMPWASKDMVVKTDQAAAKTLLEEAGWLVGADGIRHKNDLRAAFVLRYPANDSVRQSLASEFANQMKEIGIEVKVEGGSWDDLYKHAYADPILWGWGSNSPIELYELNYSSGWGNYASYHDPQTDTYLDQALAVTTVEESYALWQKAQWDGSGGFAPQGAASWVWLANVDHLYFKRNGLDVANQKLHPHGHGWSLVNNLDAWKWK